MRTRIRELRKIRGLTLKELADKIGTTPQTVQRLETANMTVSTSWLEKIASALNVDAVELISGASGREIPFLGRIGPNGAIYRITGIENSVLTLDIPAENPVAARLELPVGGYDAGVILIANKLREADYMKANGADCLAGLETGVVLLRRLYLLAAGGYVLAPLNAGQAAEQNPPLSWLGRIVMAVRYL